MTVSASLQAVLDRIAGHAAGEPDPPDWDCDECYDMLWVRAEVPEHQRVEFGPDHYYRPCSRCLPERYQVQVVGPCSDPHHIDRGGCGRCRKYVQPWTNTPRKRVDS